MSVHHQHTALTGSPDISISAETKWQFLLIYYRVQRGANFLKHDKLQTVMQEHKAGVWEVAQKQSKSHNQTHLTHFLHAQSKISLSVQSGCHSQWPPLFLHVGPAADVVTSHSDVRWSVCVCVICHHLPDLLVPQETETFVTGAFISWSWDIKKVLMTSSNRHTSSRKVSPLGSFRSLTQSSSLTFIILKKFLTCWL